MDNHDSSPNLSLRPPPKEKVGLQSHSVSMGTCPQQVARTRRTQISRPPWSRKRGPTAPNLESIPKIRPLPSSLQIPFQPRYGDNTLLSPPPPKILAPEIWGLLSKFLKQQRKPTGPIQAFMTVQRRLPTRYNSLPRNLNENPLKLWEIRRKSRRRLKRRNRKTAER